ncbi:MAG: winged helix-turn-helix transcriptional regulator [Thaumarchaeota archaeon]|nr:winged helix-turn-helix transcriptional regulator [Nitrososphaerota archaeon]
MSVTINRKGKTLESQIEIPEVKSGLSIASRTKDTVSKNSTLKEELSLKIKKLQGDVPENETSSKKDKVLEIGPLESVFPCSESKILDFLIMFQEFDYSISDIAEHSGIGFKTALEVIKDLEERQVIVNTRNVGRALMYRLNLDSKHVQSISQLATDIAIRNIKENKKLNDVKEARCPKCGLIAHNQDEIGKKFGMRNHRGKQIVQSWCRECR